MSYGAVLVVLTSSYHITLRSDICIYLSFSIRTLRTSTIQQIVHGHEVIFLSLNLVLLPVVFVTCVLILCSVNRSTNQIVAQKRRMRSRKRSLLVRLSAVLLSTMCCWFPVLIPQLINQLGEPVPSVVTIWIATFFMPMNATFCPLIFVIIPKFLNNRAKKK